MRAGPLPSPLPRALAALCVAASGCAGPPPGPAALAQEGAAGGNLVVDLTDGADLDAARARTGLDLRWAHPLSADEALAVVTVADPAAAAAALRGIDGVELAEPMVAYEALGYPDDPAWPRQWHLAQVGAPSGWRSGGGAGITVAVIDTGLRRVPDLDGARVLPGASFVAGEPDVTDLNGHGTHVAGTLAQVTHNGQGAAGMSPSITLLPLKALSGAGQGQSAWIAAAIDEAADQGARVINLSLGGPPSAVIAKAVADAQARGVLIVAAAGNSGAEGVASPAHLPGVLAVGATGPSDELAPYSTWGPELGISAPGGDKRVPGGGVIQETALRGGDPALEELQGTSMATPHVAAAAAALASATGAEAAWIADRLQARAVDLGPPGPDPRFGHGRLDLARALHDPSPSGRLGLGWIAALLAALLSRALGPCPPARTVGVALVALITAAGLPLVWALPVGPSGALALLGRPALLWPALLLPDPWARAAAIFSAAAPFVAVFLLGPHRRLGPAASGFAIGVGAHLLHGALTGSLDPWPLPGRWGDAWLAVNGVIALVLGVGGLGVARLRDRGAA